MLELHKMSQYLVVFPIVFILFYERGCQVGALKVMRNDDFLVF